MIEFWSNLLNCLIQEQNLLLQTLENNTLYAKNEKNSFRRGRKAKSFSK